MNSDRENPIDRDWLLSIGFRPLIFNLGGLGLLDKNGQIERHEDGQWVVNCLAYKPSHFTTRGQLLDLLSALGIKPNN